MLLLKKKKKKYCEILLQFETSILKKPLLQSSMMHDFSEIILIVWFGAPFLILMVKAVVLFNIFAWKPLYIFSFSHISFSCSCSDAYIINICWRKQPVSFSAGKLTFEDLESVNTSIIRSEMYLCESNLSCTNWETFSSQDTYPLRTETIWKGKPTSWRL